MNINNFFKVCFLCVFKPKIFFFFLIKQFKYKTGINYLREQMHLFYRRYKYNQEFDLNEIDFNIKNFKITPKLSIVMPIYNVSAKYLSKAILSVESQFYTNWELCLCDDGSCNIDTLDYLKLLTNEKIKIKYLEKNSGISTATNHAISMASGEYIVFMDNDDELTKDALYEIIRAINTTNADFIYSDEDFIASSGQFINPHFKSDYNPYLLLSHNYITHLVAVTKKLGDKIGWLRSVYDGAQDYDFVLRATKEATKIVHIPKVLYHWRMIETSTSSNANAKPEAVNLGRLAVEDFLLQNRIKASVRNANLPFYYKAEYPIENNPLVSIIIPFKDQANFLEKCINSILTKSIYQNYEIIGISNNSIDSKTFSTMTFLQSKDSRIQFHELNIPFNYSLINNYAVKNFAKGEHIILLNNDIEILSKSWIEEMLMFSQKKNIGCVGIKLFYPDGKIQHAGVIIGLGGYAAHSHRLADGNSYGYFNRLNVVQNLSAVTGACLMIKKDLYLSVAGLDEEKFTIAYNDVDFCLRISKSGYLNIYTPYAEAIHYESISRGIDSKDSSKNARFNQEKTALLAIHGDVIKQGDPFYNINLTRSSEDFSLRG